MNTGVPTSSRLSLLLTPVLCLLLVMSGGGGGGFPTNQLPLEFQQEHGTIDLVGDDVKPELDGNNGVEDEDLGLDGIERGVWLCKVSDEGSLCAQSN